ncbi:hypothetical protein Tco_0631852 [Tanacetum coccineum]
MLDRTDFASWQQRIRLYCPGKENGVNILKSIDEGPFQMGTFQETLAEGNEGALHLGPERPRVYSDLSPEDKERMLLEGSELTKEDRESQLYDDFEHFRQNKGETIHDYCVLFAKLINDMRNIKMTMSRMQLNSKNQAIVQDDKVVVQNVQGQQNRGQGNNAWGVVRNYTQPKQPQNSEYFKDKMLLMQAHENGVALDEEQLLFIAADDYDAFDSDVDKAPTARTMFMENLSSVDPVYDEASPSYDSDILSEVHDHDHYQDAVCEHHEVHEMHDDYVKDNAFTVVQSNVSSVPNDAYMMLLNDIYEPSAQCVYVPNAVDNSLTAELATYKE